MIWERRACILRKGGASIAEIAVQLHAEYGVEYTDDDIEYAIDPGHGDWEDYSRADETI